MQSIYDLLLVVLQDLSKNPGITSASFITSLLIVYWGMRWFVRSRKFYGVNGKVVLITGANSGLGEACAHVFYKAGAKVILCGRKEKELQRVKNSLLQLKTDQTEPEILLLDLSESGTLESKAQKAISLFGHVDVLINNAGISYRGDIVGTGIDVDRRLMEVNYFGQVALTKALLPSMMRRRSGHIVAISSIQGKLSVPYRSCYSASKHATDAFFTCLRAEVADHNIKVLIVSPSYISNTNISRNVVTVAGSAYASKVDATSALGMQPAFVASEVLIAVECGYFELLIAPLTKRMTVYVRNFYPNSFATAMKKRAMEQKQSLDVGCYDKKN